MDFQLTEEQKSYIALINDFCRREVKKVYIDETKFLDELTLEEARGEGTLREKLRAAYPWEFIQKTHDVGLKTLPVPKKYGGGGADLLTQMVVGEALGRWGSLCGFITHGWKWINDFRTVASEELQDEIFPKFMENPRLLTATSITEADAASDTMMPYDEPGKGMKTTAVRDGNEWVINGEKHFCTGGGQADLLLVYARTDRDAPISNGMSLFLVPTDTPGFSIARVNDMIINALVRNVDPLFEDVRIPARYLVGEENKAMTYWDSGRARMLTYLCKTVGDHWRIYELTKDYAKTRIQGGKPIFEHLNIGPVIVEMRLRIESLRYLVYKYAWDYDQLSKEQQVTTNSLGYNLCNALDKEIGMKNAIAACDVYGGLASMKELPIEAYARARYLTLHGSSTRNMNLIKCMRYI